ncbi:MAG TPA: DUF3556 domain-containing protein [Myxococcales bacterium]|nr:DUF3556 domain-containing protein [Myxococcales bacterium]
MGLLDPIAPPYDPLEWAKQPFAEKSRAVCRTWALQGYGTPLPVYALYLLKVLFYAGGWAFFCGFTPGLGGLRSIGSWWLEPVAFQKAIVWSMLFEILGLGCGSGPLTGRYFPPLGGFLYFLRPGTTKLPLFPRLPLLGGARRTWLDVLLYAAALACMMRALCAPAIGFAQIAPVAALVALLGAADKTLFLVARAEHYWTTAMVFALAPSGWIPGAKAVQAALWFWAGVSKLNHHFPAVVCVMTSNSPFSRFEWLRRRMYRSYPDDLSPSRLAVVAHGGTALEFAVPLLLLAGDGGPLTLAGLVLMVALHAFITSNVPMGVPIEWNFMMVYGGFFLFWRNAAASVLAVPPLLAAFLLLMLVAVPLLGNLFPSRISFLLAMRYYAGNWANSIWLFKGDSHRKLDRLTKSSPWIYDQLGRFYDRRTAVGIVGRVMAFRLMHLHGRALPLLVPKAVDRVEDYEWVDGELVAGMVLGWNFGEGHLHDEQLLKAVQEQCGFEAGELRCVFVESQPLGGWSLRYRIADAKSGPIEEGEIAVADLLQRPPWPAGA